jgi:hypothetical protein
MSANGGLRSDKKSDKAQEAKATWAIFIEYKGNAAISIPALSRIK